VIVWKAQQQLNILHNICTELGLTINNTKTKTTGISFEGNNKKIPVFVRPIQLNGSPLAVIPPNENFSVLGYIINCKLNSGHVSMLLKKKTSATIKELNLIGLKLHHAISILNSVVLGQIRYYSALNNIQENILTSITKKMRYTVGRSIYASFNGPSTFFHVDRQRFGLGMQSCQNIRDSSAASSLICLLNSPLPSCSTLLNLHLLCICMYM
jgi:hypothetical protein